MYKIGEFSKITSLSVKTLRYYNEIGLLDPALVEESTGYRYYDQQNYETALMIRTLKRFEFSISELLEIVPKIETSEDLGVYLLENLDSLTLMTRSEPVLRALHRFHIA